MAVWACGRFLVSMNAIVCAYSMTQLLHTILLLMSGKAFPQPVVSLGVLTYTCDQVSHWAAALTSITIISTISDPWCVVPIWFKVLHSFNRIPPHKWSSQTGFSHCWLYRGKPWQQGITPTNQGQNLEVNGVMLCCQGFPMYKNHTAGVPASKVDTMFFVMLTVHFADWNAHRPGFCVEEKDLPHSHYCVENFIEELCRFSELS
jgi:hypothetical protein